MKYNWVIVLISVLFLLGSGSFFAVHATYIDFETLADGITAPTNRSSGSTAYETLGVTFSGGGYTTQPRFRLYSQLSELIAERPVSNEWFLMTDTRNPPQPFDLNIFFASGVSEVSGGVVYNPTSQEITVNAYGAHDLLLESAVMASGQSTWIGDNFSFTSSSDIIYRIELVSDFSAGLGLDNLFFEPVPEPGTILLIGFGLIGFSGILRKNRDTDYKK